MQNLKACLVCAYVISSGETLNQFYFQSCSKNWIKNILLHACLRKVRKSYPRKCSVYTNEGNNVHDAGKVTHTYTQFLLIAGKTRTAYTKLLSETALKCIMLMHVCREPAYMFMTCTIVEESSLRIPYFYSSFYHLCTASLFSRLFISLYHLSFSSFSIIYTSSTFFF